jgi:hypothetical protein
MKKIIKLILLFFLLAFLVNRAVLWLVEIWTYLLVGGLAGLTGYLLYQYLKYKKDWR